MPVLLFAPRHSRPTPQPLAGPVTRRVRPVWRRRAGRAYVVLLAAGALACWAGVAYTVAGWIIGPPL